eukprot:304062-Chlamydomonas_euryale.AAC.20
MQPTAGGNEAARLPLTVSGTSEAIAWAPQARYVGITTAREPPHAQAPGGDGESRQCQGSMRTQAMLYRVDAVQAFLYALPKTSGLMDWRLQPLVSSHNAYLHRVTGMGRSPEGSLHPTAQMCCRGVPQARAHIHSAATHVLSTYSQDA